MKGRVIEVSEEDLQRVDHEGKPVPEATLLVFGDAGLAKVPLRVIESVRPVGSQVALAWSRAVGATALQPERERLVVRGASGGGPVAVGYTTEAPVWRTTYRLVMGKKQARLQGFALVHNDSDEAWDGVKVTLASGHPTSFLFPLAGPRYGRRELMSPQDGLDTAPQLATREAREHLRGEGEWAGVSGVGAGGGGSGSGSGSLGAGQHRHRGARRRERRGLELHHPRGRPDAARAGRGERGGRSLPLLGEGAGGARRAQERAAAHHRRRHQGRAGDPARR